MPGSTNGSRFFDVTRLAGITTLLSLLSAPAGAEFVLTLDDPNTPGVDIRVVDEGGFDIGAGNGLISYCYDNGILDLCVNASSKGAIGSPTAPEMSLEVNSLTFSGSSLVVAVTDTDFQSEQTFGAGTISGLITGGEALEYAFFGDEANQEFGESFRIGDGMIESPSLAFVDSVAAAANPVGSVTISVTLVDDGSSQITADFFAEVLLQGEAVEPPLVDDRLVDLVTLGDVNDNGTPDLALLDVPLSEGTQGEARVRVHDGGTGDEVFQATLSESWKSLALDTVTASAGPRLAILQQTNGGDIRVHVRSANDGAVVGNVRYFDGEAWTPIDILRVRDAGGPGIEGIGVLAENPAGQQAIEVHKVGNGALVERVFYFNDIWTAWDAIDLGEFNGNGRSEMSVLATNNAGKHAVETRDALSTKQISRHFFLGPDNVVIGLADVADVNGNSRPELVVLGNKDAANNTANTIQTKDVKTGDLISKVGTYGPDFVGFGIRSIGDVDGNSAEEVVVAVLNTVDNSTSVSVRDVAANTLTNKTGFLGPAYDPRDVEVLDDVSGNSIQEVLVVGVRPDANFRIRIQARDALTGELYGNIDLN
jgi:hypothetical protein